MQNDKWQVELTVPAQREMMIILRMTTMAALTRTGLCTAKMDDMKLAVEEAANCFLQFSVFSTLTVAYETTADGVLITLQGLEKKAECRASVSEEEINITRCLLEVLADNVDIRIQDGYVQAIILQGKYVE